MRTRFIVVLLAFCAIILPGCIDFGEDIWINPDGTGRLRVDIALPEAFLAMGKSDADSSHDLGAHFRDAEKVFRANPHVSRASARDTVIADMHHFIFEVDAKSYGDLPEIHHTFFADTALNSGGSDGPGHPDLTVTTSNNLVHVVLSLPADTTQHADSSGMADSLGSAISAAMFGDKGFVFRVHAQNIPKSSGSIDTVGHFAEWKVPFTAMKKAAGSSFTADVVLLQPITSVSVWGWVIAGALVLVGFVAFIFRRSAAKRSS